MIKVKFMIEMEFVEAVLPALPRQGDWITFRYEGKESLMKTSSAGLVTGEVIRVYFQESDGGVFQVNIHIVNPVKSDPFSRMKDCLSPSDINDAPIFNKYQPGK